MEENSNRKVSVTDDKGNHLLLWRCRHCSSDRIGIIVDDRFPQYPVAYSLICRDCGNQTDEYESIFQTEAQWNCLNNPNYKEPEKKKSTCQHVMSWMKKLF